MQKRETKKKNKVFGTKERPRLSVFKSNRWLYAQLINDETGRTLAGISSAKLAKSASRTGIETAKELGKQIALLGKKAKITKVIFDRGRFVYKGKIKAVADGAREGGLQF